MPVYDYRCPICGDTQSVVCAIADTETRRVWDEGGMYHSTSDHFVPYRRVFSFSSPADPIGDGYYDNSVGAWITSKRALDDHNKAASEAHTARTGVETNFVAHDIRDAAPRLLPDPD